MDDHFPVLAPGDLDDALVDDGEDMADLILDGDPARFRESRPGDFLMCPFQCDECTFFNVKGRYSQGTEQDKLLELCIRRAILDAFWSRERSTVAKNRTEMKGILDSATLMGITNPLPDRGPFPNVDTWGMSTACAMLLKTLRSGINSRRIQFETARKVRSTVSNFLHTVPGGTGISTVGQGERGGLMFSGSPTNSFWFKRFMAGCHRRMGDVWIPDRAITTEEVLCALDILNTEYQSLAAGQRRLEVCWTGSLLVAGFAGALRGEEIVQIDLGLMRKYWFEGRDYERKPHVTLTLVGRFKHNPGMLKVFVLPLALRTQSGIEIQLWLERLIEEYHLKGIATGPLFRVVNRKGQVKQASIGDLDSLFYDILRRVQARKPDLISETTRVEDEFSVKRSLRRGATTEAQNRKIPNEVIERNNRWRKHMKGRGVLPGMSMLERYTDARASVEAIVEFSERL